MSDAWSNFTASRSGAAGISLPTLANSSAWTRRSGSRAAEMGHGSAFHELHERHRERMFRVAHRITRNRRG